MSKIIGLGFRKRVGKDEIASHLVKAHGFKRIGWADALKKGVHAFHGWEESQVEGDQKEVVDPFWGYSPRTAYQQMGTDLVRKHWDDQFWVKGVMRKVEKWLEEGHNVVIPDCRFQEEVDAIASIGWIWHVTRPGLPAPNPQEEHESETALRYFAQWSATIVNDGTIKELQDKVDNLLRCGGLYV